jgi:hypothetical protein
MSMMMKPMGVLSLMEPMKNARKATKSHHLFKLKKIKVPFSKSKSESMLTKKSSSMWIFIMSSLPADGFSLKSLDDTVTNLIALRKRGRSSS